MPANLDKKYLAVLKSLKEKIRQSRLRATLAVNNELLAMYWDIGNTILKQQKTEGWGTKVISRLAADLKLAFPDMKGLSQRNLIYMQTFAKAWPSYSITQGRLAQLPENAVTQVELAKISWYHHITLLDKVKANDVRLFYIEKTIKNGWSRDMLVHQIESQLHKRQGSLTHNFEQVMPDYESELAAQLFKDPYQLDFIMLGEEAKERDLENALMNHVTQFLLELGEGFAFMGRQKIFTAGGREFKVDLLFYHTKLRRHIIIDLKIGDFEPEFVSKMNLYLGLADDTLKGKYDEPAIGLILCKTNNKIVAEYALRDTSKPIGIAEYKIAKMLPSYLKRELPSIEVLENKLQEEAVKYQSKLSNKVKAVIKKKTSAGTAKRKTG